MVTSHESAARPWPRRLRRSPATPGGAHCDRELGDSQALRDAADLAGHAEAALAPGEPAPEHGSSEQLLADQGVVDGILAGGLRGPRHQHLEHELIKYAVPVLCHLLRDGAIFGKARRLGRPAIGSDAWLDFTNADREDLAHEMVARALPVFTAAVFEERRWKAHRRASLRTYFVNACVLQFAAIYRERLGERAAIPAGLDLSDLHLDPVGGTPGLDTVDTVVTHDEAIRMLRQIGDSQVVDVLLLRGAGYRAADAAREVGMTPTAAESKLGRIRKHVKSDQHGSELPGTQQRDTSPGGRWEQ